MSEQPQTPQPAANPSQLLIDLGPIVLFVLAYNVLERIPATKDNAVFTATAIFVAATLATMLYSYLKTGKVAPVLIVTGVLITAFGGLTLALHDTTFLKLRPTVVNFFYGVSIIASVLIGQNVWKLLFGHVFVLPDRIWNVLALRWGVFFLVMGCVAEYIRRTLSTGDWVTWHTPILYVPTVLFAIANTPLVLKHSPPDEKPATET